MSERGSSSPTTNPPNPGGFSKTPGAGQQEWVQQQQQQQQPRMMTQGFEPAYVQGQYGIQQIHPLHMHPQAQFPFHQTFHQQQFPYQQPQQHLHFQQQQQTGSQTGLQSNHLQLHTQSSSDGNVSPALENKAVEASNLPSSSPAAESSKTTEKADEAEKEYGNAEGEEDEEGGEGGEGGEDEEMETSVKMLVPNNMVGTIIGKGGASIKDITAQTGVKIHIAQGDDATLERILTVTGTLSGIAQAQHHISLKMQEESFSEIKDFESSVPMTERMSLIPLRLLVPNMVVGRLIGKGGTNLKKTMVETNTYITCSKEDEINRFTGDRIVSILGSVDNQNKALNSVVHQVNLYLQSQNPPAGGTGGGGGSASVGGGGGAAPSLMHQKDLKIISHGHYDPGYPAGLLRGGPPRLDYGFNYTSRVAPELQDQEDTIYIQVPNGVVGSIIGKGGATVKEIASRSRCLIRVARNEEVDTNASHRPVSVSGTIDALFKAQALIYSKIAEAPPAIGGGGDQPLRVEMLIPPDMVGRVIGKKGSQVKKITEISGARLTITQQDQHLHLQNHQSSGESEKGEKGDKEKDKGAASDEAQGGGTVVTILGRLESNLTAQHLIHEILYYHQPLE